MEPTQAKFEGWAIVELMGHQRECGYVTTEAYGQAVLFRVDVPGFPEREYILPRPTWTNAGDRLCAGAKVRREEIPARSRLISPSAIYALNPCTEEAAKAAIEASITPTLILLEAPKGMLLEAGTATDDDYEAAFEEVGE